MFRSRSSLLLLIISSLIAVWSCSEGTAPVAFQPIIEAFSLGPLPEIESLEILGEPETLRRLRSARALVTP